MLSVLRSAAENATETLGREKADGASDKQAAERAFMKGVGDVAVDAVVGTFFEKDYIEGAKGREKLKNAVTHVKENLLGTSFQGLMDYVERVGAYKKKGFSEKQAKHIAINEILKSGGVELLDNIGLDFAQREFEKSLERAMKQRK